MPPEAIIKVCNNLISAYKSGKLGQTIMPEDSNPGFSDREREMCLAYFTLPCAGIGLTFLLNGFSKINTEARFADGVNWDRVKFFERAAELYTILFERLGGATTAEKLRLRIESTAIDLAEVIKNRPSVVGPADLVQESSAEERKLLRAAVGLIVHLKLMDTDKINAMLFDESDWEALQKYRAERVYQKLFETTQAV